ncbi:TRAP transporter small permease [Stappia sp.]|uniref:TRAP transporter small permease n=1 Tax=Stappia sp. TaxID=1870903 RepID=UPI003A99C88F
MSQEKPDSATAGRETSLPARLVTGLPGAGTRVLQLVAAVLLLVMMTVTFIDVIGRYLFNAPLPGAFELTEVLLALVVFVGLPIVTARREHVTVDLLTGRLPGGLRAALAWLATLATGLVLALLAWRLATSARDFSAYGDATVYLGIPLGPVAGIMAGLTGLAALVAGVLLFRRN